MTGRSAPAPAPAGDAGRTGLEAALRHYAATATASDLMAGATPAMAPRWAELVGALSAGGLDALQARVGRQVLDLGMAFRLAGEAEERAWPLSPVPLLLPAGAWRRIEDGLAQRADVLEAVVADIYGRRRLVADGLLPAAAIAGSHDHWRQMEGVPPPRGHYLRFYAADLAMAPGGEWRILADHVRAPTGAGYALENRLAMARATGDLLGRLNVRRLAPFFAAFRRGLAAACDRADPRIALLTPGRFNPSYAEQAHLARYLGLLLVEGDDLTVQGDRLYVRTIEGIKRIDALWRRLDTRFLDPLAFDSGSTIGVPDLFEAIRHGTLAIANWPGVGVIEAPAFAAFLPGIGRAMTGRDLALPDARTWWCGRAEARAHVLANLDHMAIGPAFARPLPGMDDGRPRIGARLTAAEREAVAAGMARRPMDYVGQELVHISTTPALIDGALAARPFVLRAFLARGADGGWHAMPGGFARLAAHGDIRAALMGDGDMSADVCIVSDRPEAAVSLLDQTPSPAIRRLAGTLPSKAADNLFWLGRYLERAETVLRMARALAAGSLEAGGSALAPATLDKVAALLVEWGAADAHEDCAALGRAAIRDRAHPGSVHALVRAAAAIAEGLRERLSVDVWRLLSRPLRAAGDGAGGAATEEIAELSDRFAALAGLAAENMVRGHGWRFHDMGRRVERAVVVCRLIATLADEDATDDDLTLLLDLADCQIAYRMRYLSGHALMPVRDMLALEPSNPRSLAFGVDRIAEHVAALPSLADDGMPEAPVRIAAALAAALAAADAATLDVRAIDARLLALSDAVARRFFLAGREAGRATGMTRLA